MGDGFCASPTLVALYPCCALSRGVEAVVHVTVAASVSLCHDGLGGAPASLSTS